MNNFILISINILAITTDSDMLPHFLNKLLWYQTLFLEQRNLLIFILLAWSLQCSHRKKRWLSKSFSSTCRISHSLSENGVGGRELRGFLLYFTSEKLKPCNWADESLSGCSSNNALFLLKAEDEFRGAEPGWLWRNRCDYCSVSVLKVNALLGFWTLLSLSGRNKKKKQTVSEDKRICLFFDGRCCTVVVTDNVTRDSPDPWVLADQKLSYKLTGT